MNYNPKSLSIAAQQQSVPLTEPYDFVTEIRYLGGETFHIGTHHGYSHHMPASWLRRGDPHLEAGLALARQHEGQTVVLAWKVAEPA